MRPTGDSAQIWARVAAAFIIALGFALSSHYAIRTPMWQYPDEPAHYNYAFNLASTGQMVEIKAGDWDQERLERLKADRFPAGEDLDWIQYENHQPPLYYALVGWLATIEPAASADQRVYALRLFTALIGCLALALAYRFIGLLLPADAWTRLFATLFFAAIPMHAAMLGAVNNDALGEVIAVGLLVAASVALLGGVTYRRALLIGVLIGLALLTKVTIYPVAGVCAVAILWRIWRRGAGEPKWGLTLMVAVSSIALSGWWFVRNMIVYGLADPFGLARHDLVVVGQPRTGPITGEAVNYFVTTMFNSFWGQFGWMGVPMERRVYLVLLVGMILAAIGMAIAIGRLALAGRLRIAGNEAWILATVVIGVTLAEVVYYNLTYIQAQGRYLFPALTGLAALMAVGWRELLFVRFRPAAYALATIGLVVLNYVAIYRYIIPALAQ